MSQDFKVGQRVLHRSGVNVFQEDYANKCGEIIDVQRGVSPNDILIKFDDGAEMWAYPVPELDRVFDVEILSEQSTSNK